MIDELRLLSGDNYEINKHIKIFHPTIRMIKDYGEQKYFSVISNLTSIPSDVKSFLYDNGYDYEKVTDLELFIMLCKNLDKNDTSIILGDIDFKNLSTFIDKDTQKVFLAESVSMIDEIIELNDEDLNNFIANTFGEIENDIKIKLLDIISMYKNNKIDLSDFKSFFDDKLLELKFPRTNGIKIDEHIHMLISDYLRKIHGFEKKVELAGNAMTKTLLIDLDREDRQMKNKNFKSILAPLIKALVNCSDFPYDFTTIWDLPISVFMDSVRQIQKFINFKFTMSGVYSGNVDIKKINKKDLNWI